MPPLDYSYDLKHAKRRLSRARRLLAEAEHKSLWCVKLVRMKEQFAVQCALIETEGREAEIQVDALQNAVANLSSQVDSLEDIVVTTKRIESRARRT